MQPYTLLQHGAGKRYHIHACTYACINVQQHQWQLLMSPSHIQRIELSSAPFNGNVQVVLKAFLVPIVMNVLELILPRFFEFVARVEMFKTRGREVAMTMIRTAVVRIGNLGVYTLILYAVISCTQQAGDLYLLPYTNNESCVEVSVGTYAAIMPLLSILYYSGGSCIWKHCTSNVCGKII